MFSRRETAFFQGVSDGSIDIYISTSGGAAGVFPYVQVLDLPYLMANDRIAEDVMQGDFVRTMRKMALKDSNDTIRLMTVGNTGGWRNFANTKRRIAEPSDMKGLKIRTVVADLPQELVKALGASPTPIPWPELFTSFQTGVNPNNCFFASATYWFPGPNTLSAFFINLVPKANAAIA